jgi:Brp/Blh family beta-carotene 15,15'-monooxygenase
MKDALANVYSKIEAFSRLAILATIAIFLTLRIFGLQLNLSAQVAIALIGLVIGIPHGAIDHLISIPAHLRSRFALYIIAYVAIAVTSGAMIAIWNLRGFQAVLIMSSLHFGYGDAAYRNEWRGIEGKEKFPVAIETLYAIPAGFLPVVLPLTDPKSGDALHRIRTTLESWAGSESSLLRTVTLSVGAISIALLLATKCFQFAIDLTLLAALALIAPPLVAFATYFGFWHATRHTARLVPKLPRARSLAAQGACWGAIRAAIIPGLYAVAGSALVASGLMLFDRRHFSSSLLWSALVLIWALTVPHMLSTSRFDLRALRK